VTVVVLQSNGLFGVLGARVYARVASQRLQILAVLVLTKAFRESVGVSQSNGSDVEDCDTGVLNDVLE
jgi:hypothetical protein